MNRLDYHYLWLLKKIKEDGVQKEGRNGWTRSIFGYQIRHHMDEGFPLLTTKKMWWKGIRTELEWFLNGDTNIQYLVERGNNIWVGDAYKRYFMITTAQDGNNKGVLNEKEFIEKIKEDDAFAEEWGDMGPIYGKQWRNWTAWKDDGMEMRIDQIQKLIDDINKKPDSRRLMVNAWNVADIDDMVLPPCHYGFQVWTRELHWGERAATKGFLEGTRKALRENYLQNNKNKTNGFGEYDFNDSMTVEEMQDEMGLPKRGISLMWNQRSVDTPLGLPFNIASYGLLLEMIADEVMMKPLELVGNLGDCHIYENQLEGVEEQLKREDDIHELPTVHIRDGIWSRGDGDIILQNYESEDSIYFPLSN